MHNKNTVLALAGLATLASVSLALAQTRNYDFEAFVAIDASSGIEVVVSQGAPQTVRVEARDEADFDNLELSVKDGTLSAATDYSLLDFIFGGGLLGMAFDDGAPLKVFITIPELEALQASSGAHITLSDFTGASLTSRASSGADINLAALAFQNVSLSASSGADIEASGTCISLTGNASSGADISASTLECSSVQANASSGANLEVFASEQVNANASSGADITISGNPQASEINSSSGGDISIRR